MGNSDSVNSDWSPSRGSGAFSQIVQTGISLASHPFRRKTRNGWGTEVYSKSKNALEPNQSHCGPGEFRGGSPLPDGRVDFRAVPSRYSNSGFARKIYPRSGSKIDEMFENCNLDARFIALGKSPKR